MMTDSELRKIVHDLECFDAPEAIVTEQNKGVSHKVSDVQFFTQPDYVTAEEVDEKINKVVQSTIDDYDDAREFSDEFLRKLLKDQIKAEKEKEQKRLEAQVVNQKKAVIDHFISTINRVEFNGPYTIIFWEDGSVTRVKCQEGEKFDKEKGVALGIIKSIFGDISYYNEIFKSLNLDEEFDKNGEFKKSFKPEQKHSGFKRIMRELFN